MGKLMQAMQLFPVFLLLYVLDIIDRKKNDHYRLHKINIHYFE